MPTKDFSIRNDQRRVETCQEVLWGEEDREKSLTWLRELDRNRGTLVSLTL